MTCSHDNSFWIFGKRLSVLVRQIKNGVTNIISDFLSTRLLSFPLETEEQLEARDDNS